MYAADRGCLGVKTVVDMEKAALGNTISGNSCRRTTTRTSSLVYSTAWARSGSCPRATWLTMACPTQPSTICGLPCNGCKSTSTCSGVIPPRSPSLGNQLEVSYILKPRHSWVDMVANDPFYIGGAVMLLAMAEGGSDEPLFNGVISASPYLPTQWSVIIVQ